LRRARFQLEQIFGMKLPADAVIVAWSQAKNRQVALPATSVSTTRPGRGVFGKEVFAITIAGRGRHERFPPARYCVKILKPARRSTMHFSICASGSTKTAKPVLGLRKRTEGLRPFRKPGTSPRSGNTVRCDPSPSRSGESDSIWPTSGRLR